MDHIAKRIAVLGSTGSIGRQTLEIVRVLRDKFQIVALAAGRNTDLLVQQALEFRPNLVYFEEGISSKPDCLDFCTFASLEEIAGHPNVDLVLVATSGKAGLNPTIAALRARKQVALANKEVLVSAGNLVMAEACHAGIDILPVDSEHSAIWQCLRGERTAEIERLVLTASGGPFFRYGHEAMSGITPEQALRHPTWQMGKKVTIDSATLMNKGMEIIEARWLFNVALSQIEVVIHPGSVVHSLVEFRDGSVKAQLSPPDMRLPIQYALTYPERLPNDQLPRMKWDTPMSLSFEKPDWTRFPCLTLAREAAEKGDTYPAVLSAADEEAVELFLAHRIGFTDIAKIVEATLEKHEPVENPALEAILEADAWARQFTADWSLNKL